MVHFTIDARRIRAEGGWLRHRDLRQNDTLYAMASRTSTCARTIQNAGSRVSHVDRAITVSNEAPVPVWHVGYPAGQPGYSGPALGDARSTTTSSAAYHLKLLLALVWGSCHVR